MLTNAQIKTYIDTVLKGPGTDAQKAAIFKSWIASNNLTYPQIAAATGYTINDITGYLALAPSQGQQGIGAGLLLGVVAILFTLFG
ncbi:MAG: hypothetical protein EB119_07310 [Synechococcaceae bacterium WBB_34_004]|nr:hypothetical protein [Synechococcaceae bacterium WBB_34_004]